MLACILKYRRALVVLFHVALIVFANYGAFWLRFDGEIPADKMLMWWQMLPWLVVIRGLMFIPFRLHEGLWRYSGIWDLRNIVAGVFSSTCVFYLLVHVVWGLPGYPRSVFLIDMLLLIFSLGSARLISRVSQGRGYSARQKRVLVYGAGDAGEMIVRDMKSKPIYGCKPIGFVDDNPLKRGRRIHGVRVLGTSQELPRIIAKEKPQEILIAIPRAEPATVRQVVKSLEPFAIPIKTLPNYREVLDGRVSGNQIRDLAVEDLLPRAPVGLDPTPVRQLIAGKRVLVTGAGGSIGSELCRQIAALYPDVLLLFERYENGLYAIEKDLSHRHPDLDLKGAIGDVTDAQRVRMVMEMYRPEIVFHAAAHKHVRLMEENPCEAVKNNIFGTRTMAEAAQHYGAERFILLSTDKSVNPSSVMGATKHVAELLVQEMDRHGATRFMAVRFGNVLGSNGSVVPHFLEQIAAGGPVTVTHPQVQRYFMLIPEAVQLVLQATAMGDGGAVYVLEMGEQIKVLELAQNLIRLAGFVPDREIPINFIGLRPGEKLFEELVETDETVEPSEVEKIVRVRPKAFPESAWLAQQLVELEQIATQGEVDAVLACLHQLVPTFRNGVDLDATPVLSTLTSQTLEGSRDGLDGAPDRLGLAPRFAG